MKAAEVAKKLEKIDEINDEGFRELSWKEIAKFLSAYGAKEFDYEDNSSVDPSCYVYFEDNSRIYVGNPHQAYFPRFYIVSEE